ncbi:uncharacterized protein BDZ99DRAFT_80664 [Mytilinidion resinicola]|uniref:Uncharacterized protein n=1 Tax=Mytilinidion resinicola TaxID=574789 RepID=A0A6A6YFW7_9PEZI|nr:uncharacterized protein BDZ99DRAFT_80664 [Mytilinidion resinicola]KAF2807489.1 hypothetical protein BDZ99DRAFT_80664 [Mytilinidion resinicola]
MCFGKKARVTKLGTHHLTLSLYIISHTFPFFLSFSLLSFICKPHHSLWGNAAENMNVSRCSTPGSEDEGRSGSGFDNCAAFRREQALDWAIDLFFLFSSFKSVFLDCQSTVVSQGFFSVVRVFCPREIRQVQDKLYSEFFLAVLSGPLSFVRMFVYVGLGERGSVRYDWDGVEWVV